MEEYIKENEMFAIEPKKNCKHIVEKIVQNIKFLTEDFTVQNRDKYLKENCIDCKNNKENWICLECNQIYCSRYVNSHMLEHRKNSNHGIALSFSDGSFWCYDCDSYITNNLLDILRQMFGKMKFPQDFQQQKINNEKEEEKKEEIKEEEKKEEIKEDIDDISKKMDDLNIEQKFDRKQLIQGLKNKQFKKICVLTGAGISVSAGIPDFRTPGTGLYDNLKQYNLPYPEAIFTLDYFRQNPKPFYVLSKEFFDAEVNYTINHHFIKQLNDQKLLLSNLTQNIDGLELQAGLPEQKLIQCHGHYRTAHCIECKEEASMQEFKNNVKNDTTCKCKCEGLIKPDIIFFGENLPLSFFEGFADIKQCDLCIVMGTSLTVAPFSSLIQMVPQQTPLVVINRENPGLSEDRILLLEGDMDTNVKNLLKDLEWEVPNIEKKEVKKIDVKEMNI